MIEMQILGNLGKDAEIKHFDNDRSVVNFSVAHTEKRTNGQGVKESFTIWAECAWWLKKDIATKVAPYLKKGKKVFCKGEPGAKGYIKESEARATLSLNVYKLEFADGPVGDKPADAPAATSANNNPVPEYAPPADISSAANDDDLPF